jgi:hypothetical protein
MCEISAGAFDNLPKLEALSISGGLEDGVLKPGLVFLFKRIKIKPILVG